MTAWDRSDRMTTVGDRPDWLPAETTSFVGRERELRELSRIMRETRLLTLTGAGEPVRLVWPSNSLALTLIVAAARVSLYLSLGYLIRVPSLSRFRTPSAFGV